MKIVLVFDIRSTLVITLLLVQLESGKYAIFSKEPIGLTRLWRSLPPTCLCTTSNFHINTTTATFKHVIWGDIWPHHSRAAQVVPAWQLGCEKMERESENEVEMERE